MSNEISVRDFRTITSFGQPSGLRMNGKRDESESPNSSRSGEDNMSETSSLEVGLRWGLLWYERLRYVSPWRKLTFVNAASARRTLVNNGAWLLNIVISEDGPAGT